MPKRSVRISDKLDSRLQTAVRDRGFATPSDFIRSAVEEALKDDESLVGMEDERIAASCGRINKDIYRVMRAQQALFAFVDAFVKTFLTCMPEPPAEIKAQSIACGLERYNRLLKSADSPPFSQAFFEAAVRFRVASKRGKLRLSWPS